LFPAPNIRVIKSRRKGWAVYIARMGRWEYIYICTFWSENLKGRDYSEDLDVDVRIILEWILNKQVLGS
jgi:hypothetical protein